MLPQKTIIDFMTKFNTLSEKIADVNIKHLLYGNQKINQCILHPFADGERIGLIINNEDVYFNMDELCDLHIDDKVCYIKSEVMELYIN